MRIHDVDGSKYEPVNIKTFSYGPYGTQGNEIVIAQNTEIRIDQTPSQGCGAIITVNINIEISDADIKKIDHIVTVSFILEDDRYILLPKCNHQISNNIVKFYACDIPLDANNDENKTYWAKVDDEYILNNQRIAFPMPDIKTNKPNNI